MERRYFNMGDCLFWLWSTCVFFGGVNSVLLLLGFEWCFLLMCVSVLLSGVLSYLVVSVIIWLI